MREEIQGFFNIYLNLSFLFRIFFQFFLSLYSFVIELQTSFSFIFLISTHIILVKRKKLMNIGLKLLLKLRWYKSKEKLKNDFSVVQIFTEFM